MIQKPTETIINFLFHRKRFCLTDVVEATGLDRRKLLRVLEKLRNEGYLEILEEEHIRAGYKEMGPARRNPRYKLIKDISDRRIKRPDNKRDKIWRTLRHLRKTTCSNLVRITGCNERTVGDYIRKLAGDGYVRSMGRYGKEKVWILVKDTGPQKPRIKET